jgi:hypothetical protein
LDHVVDRNEGAPATARARVQYVIGPLGTALTLADLPAFSTHWVPRKKAEVVCAIRGGLLTADEACDRYSLSLDELASWSAAIDAVGLRGLRVTKCQDFRSVIAHR